MTIYTDLRSDYDEGLLRRVYAELIVPSIPHEEELEDVEEWIPLLDPRRALEVDPRDAHFHVVVKHEREEIMGVYVLQYFADSNAAILGYIIVAPHCRRRGHFTSLLEHAHKLLRHLAQPNDEFEPLLFAEVNQLGYEDGILASSDRHGIFRRHGFRWVQFPYVQPPLSVDHAPCYDLILLVRSDSASVASNRLVSFLASYGSSLALFDPIWKKASWYEDLKSYLAKTRDSIPLLSDGQWEWQTDEQIFDCVVVGGGVAGLSAAHFLTDAKRGNVAVLEATSLFGGRVAAIEMETPSGVQRIEIGGEFLHGEEGIFIDWAVQHGLKLEPCIYDLEKPYNVCYMSPHGALESFSSPCKDGQAALDIMDELIADKTLYDDSATLDDVLKQRGIPEHSRVFLDTLFTHTHAANSETYSINEVLREERDWTFGTGNTKFTTGMYSVVELLRSKCEEQGVTLQSNCPVRQIDWSRSDAIRVHCANGDVLKTKYVVSTVPLAVMKSFVHSFRPALPAWKVDSVNMLNMFNAMKVICVFDETVPWPNDCSLILCPDRERYPIGEVWYNFKGVITGFITAERSDELLKNSDDDIIDTFVKQLQDMFGVDLEPFFHHGLVVDWKKNPYFQGGYSSPSIGATYSVRMDYARHVDKRLFFAGEATHLITSTVTSAFLSGKRAATEILEL